MNALAVTERSVFVFFPSTIDTLKVYNDLFVSRRKPIKMIFEMKISELNFSIIDTEMLPPNCYLFSIQSCPSFRIFDASLLCLFVKLFIKMCKKYLKSHCRMEFHVKNYI